MDATSSHLTYSTSVEAADGWGSADYQDVIALQSHGHTGLLLYTLTLAPAESCPMISIENAITASSLGTRSIEVQTVSAGDKNSWPRLPHLMQRWGYLRGGQKFILRVNRVLGWNHVYDTNKKSKGEEVLKEILWFPCSLISSPTSFLVAGCPSDFLKENINL